MLDASLLRRSKMWKMGYLAKFVCRVLANFNTRFTLKFLFAWRELRGFLSSTLSLELMKVYFIAHQQQSLLQKNVCVSQMYNIMFSRILARGSSTSFQSSIWVHVFDTHPSERIIIIGYTLNPFLRTHSLARSARLIDVKMCHKNFFAILPTLHLFCVRAHVLEKWREKPPWLMPFADVQCTEWPRYWGCMVTMISPWLKMGRFQCSCQTNV